MALMFIDHSHRLHEGIADGRPDETKAAALQILAHGIAVRRELGDVAQIERPALEHAAVRELPEVVVKGLPRRANLEIRLGITDEGIDFEPVSDDARIEQQALAL